MPFTVVGVLETKGQNLMGTNQDDVILMPITAARSRVPGSSNAARQRSVGTVWIKVADGTSAGVVEEQVRALLRQRLHLQPGVDDDFSMRNLAEVKAAQEASSRVLALPLAAVASVEAVTVVFAVGFALAIGVFFGSDPASKAARLNPVDALRFE